MMCVLEVVYGLCLSKASGPGDSSDHTIVIHLLGSCPQLHHIGEVYNAPSRMEGANTSTKAVCTAMTVSTTPTPHSWIRYM